MVEGCIGFGSLGIGLGFRVSGLGVQRLRYVP